MAGQGKQAKILTDTQVRTALKTCDEHRFPERDRAMVLLSFRVGLRAKEISCLRWSMVTDAEGNVGDALHLPNNASKGRGGGRTIFLTADLREALVALKATGTAEADDRVIFGERTIEMSPTSVQVWFHRFYRSLGFDRASSHSGRRTFVTKLAKKIVEAGGSLKDVQELAGHASLSTTQRYIQGSSDAKRKVMSLI